MSSGKGHKNHPAPSPSKKSRRARSTSQKLPKQHHLKRMVKANGIAVAQAYANKHGLAMPKVRLRPSKPRVKVDLEEEVA